MPAASPTTIRHRLLVQKLRRLREEAGFTQAEVAAEMDWSESKQIKIERGNIPVRVPDVRALLVHYGLVGADRKEETDAILQLARDARQKGWWHTYGDAVPEWFEPFLGLETEATNIRTYQSELVHGLLQTPDYYRAFMSGSVAPGDSDEFERKVALRLQRQARLDRSDAPAYWTIMNEAALHRFPGSPEMMRAQLDHILERMTLQHVTVQVLPFAAGMHPAMDGPFELLGFPESLDLDVVYLESQTGALYLEEKPQVARYRMIFDQLRAKALDPNQTRALITQRIREVT
ncbi:helix-turn-helix domain-containing protein [Actinomadura verrucosospora]|uniref:XRE family transcriptional regulator n=1 Tax=Actinomadura verrucosospora TaxID=46165 RepID=A0A7D3VVE2_ACTVE|nr:helix-turn-helix transcriptional regulator [Actinomadura verrucosospora]QKG24315.1 XRE family transcriptional regulator [Actinomadura verrucosospora]